MLLLRNRQCRNRVLARLLFRLACSLLIVIRVYSMKSGEKISEAPVEVSELSLSQKTAQQLEASVSKREHPLGKQRLPPSSSVDSSFKESLSEDNGKSTGSCQYGRRGRWLDCEIDGSQKKVMRLVSGGPECEANKTIRRDCEAVGCRYARGQWSSNCIDGQRFRVDTLVARRGSDSLDLALCKPQRRVIKDCKRTCHYVKSAWSACTNGFRTRLLELEGSWLPAASTANDAKRSATNTEPSQPLTPPPAASVQRHRPDLSGDSVRQAARAERDSGKTRWNNETCARQKLIKRACSQTATHTISTTSMTNSTATTAASTSTTKTDSTHTLKTTGPNNNPPSARPHQRPGAAGANLAGPQRRRLKQIQLKHQQRQQQQQQQQQQNNPKSITGSSSGRPPTTSVGSAVASVEAIST